MDDLTLCDICSGLIFWHGAKSMSHKYYRTVGDLRRSVETTTCPFCEAFHVSLCKERPDAKADARCKFRLHTEHDGFIQLTILLCHSLRIAPDSDKWAVDYDDKGLKEYVQDVCHWMIANAESKSLASLCLRSSHNA